MAVTTWGHMTKRRDDRDFIEALARGLEIIRTYTAFSPVRTVSDIAAELGITRPTVHRIMSTLEQLGYVVQTDDGYYLSAKVIELGFGYITTRGFYGAAKTHLEKLAADIDQPISLCELIDCDIVYVGRVEVPKVVAYNVSLGQRLPARSTALGRLLLSGLDDAELAKRLAMPSMSHVQPMISLADDELRAEIATIRKQGWSLTDQTMSLGYRAVAAPLYDATGTMVAAIGLVVHGSEIPLERLTGEVVPRLIETAEAITEDFVTMAKMPRMKVAPVEPGYVTFTASTATPA